MNYYYKKFAKLNCPMKLLKYFALLICLHLTSCKKEPLVNTPTTIQSRLLKTATYYTSASPNKNVDSFSYDNKKRLIYFSKSSRGNQYTYDNYFEEIRYAYSENSMLPNDYTINFYGGESFLSSTKAPEVIRDTLLFNNQNQWVLDSTVYSDHISSASTARINYSTSFFIQKTSYPSDSMYFQLDTVFLNDKGNPTGITRYSFSKNDTSKTISTYTFSNTLNPLYTNPGLSFLYGKVYKYMLMSAEDNSYNRLSTRPSYQYTYQWIIDSNGLLTQSSYVLKNLQANSSTTNFSDYTYY